MKLLNFFKTAYIPRWDGITVCSCILAGIFTLGIMLLPNVHASTKNDAMWAVEEMASDIIENGTSVIAETVKGEGVYGDIFKYVTGVKRTTEFQGSWFDGTAEYVTVYERDGRFEEDFKVFFRLLTAVGGCWILVMAAARLIKGLGDGRDGLELVLKFFFEICVTVTIILNIGTIISGFCTVAVDIAIEASEVRLSLKESEDSNTWYGMVEAMVGAECPSSNKKWDHFVWNVQAIVLLIVPWIMHWVIFMAALFVLLQTLMEIAIRKAFIAFAVADIYNEGLRSPGVRYIKRLVGAILKFSICILAAEFSKKIGVSATGVAYAFTIIAVDFVAIGIMFKAGEYTNDILGV